MATQKPTARPTLGRSQRIPLNRSNIGPMLAVVRRARGWLLHVETDRYGDTVAYLERRQLRSVRS